MTDWKLTGTYFETCNCETACPCVFLSPPTEGDCTVLIAWHIDEGRYGDTALDGLNVALVVYAPGTMVETKWKAGAYFDDRATDKQAEALHAIFGGKAGGHPEVLASFIGELVGAKNAKIRYAQDGKRGSLTIGDVLEAEIEAMEGQGGQPITIANHPLCIAPGVPATVGRSKGFRVKDFGFDVTVSGRNGFLSDFAYQSA